MKIALNFSHVLDDLFRELQNSQDYPEPSQIILKSQEYQIIWDKFQKDILTAYQSMLGLTFSDKLIKVFVVGRIPHAISSPIIINSHMDDDRFLYVLSHELIHELLSENSEGKLFAKKIAQIYPTESFKTSVHVVVNAILQKLFVDYMDMPHLVETDRQISSGNEVYDKAWEIVDRDGKDKIIETIFKAS